jgi:hypothetical protein
LIHVPPLRHSFDTTRTGLPAFLSTRMLSNAILLRSSASGDSVLVFAKLLLKLNS